ncbi:MAG: hypothetical protein RMJ53_03745 [Chitinophagales bacterium]|nr:hypothetical protein [Chitinophagales bacterium]MDW8273327.1 hypothetical protein [Chitinophagales bacterium]
MLKYNTTLLKKIEEILRATGYTVRYEKGNFNNGCCVLEQKKVIVINKFHSLESKINSLIEILSESEVNPEMLEEDERKLYLLLMSEKSPSLFG